MKLSTLVIAGAVTVASTASFADHGYSRPSLHRDCKHELTAHRLASETPTYRGARGGVHYARVLNVEPVYRYHREPQGVQRCTRYEPQGSRRESYAGTVFGAVIGGAIGHRIGDSSRHRDAAAIAGGLLGAALGRDMDRNAQHRRELRVDGPCRVTHRERPRRELVEYRVTYRYNGRVHRTTMDYDPGEWVKLHVDVAPA